MSIDSIQGVATRMAGGEPEIECAAAVVDLRERAHQAVRDALPALKNRALSDPCCMDEFHAGLLKLPVAQRQTVQPGQPEGSKELRNRQDHDNRRLVFDYVRSFTGDTGKPLYTKLPDQMLALARSRELIADGKKMAPQQAEPEALNVAVDKVFAAAAGMNKMALIMLTEDMFFNEENEIEKEW